MIPPDTLPGDHRAAPRTARARAARVLRWCERGLVVVGVACLVVWASACAKRSLFQHAEGARFEAAIHRALVAERHDQSEWSAQRVEAFATTSVHDVEALGRLEIPDAGVSVMVLDGTEDATLDRAVGRIPGTARIGEPGNLGIAGHRDGFFRGLRHLEVGDEIALATYDGVTRYSVIDLHVVDPDAVDVLAPTTAPTITLVTCFPFYYVGSAPQRYIVQGRQVAFEPWTSETAAAWIGSDLASR